MSAILVAGLEAAAEDELPMSPPVANLARFNLDFPALAKPPPKRARQHHTHGTGTSSHGQQQPPQEAVLHGVHGTGARRRYYCKYCRKSWPMSHFRNSQQFGAHCSNCSRKPRPQTLPDGNSPPSPASEGACEMLCTLSRSAPLDLPQTPRHHHHHAHAQTPPPQQQRKAGVVDVSPPPQPPSPGVATLHASPTTPPDAVVLDQAWRSLCRAIDDVRAVATAPHAGLLKAGVVVDAAVCEYMRREQAARASLRALVSQAAVLASVRAAAATAVSAVTEQPVLPVLPAVAGAAAGAGVVGIALR
eukprot:m51a1_g360 putative gata-binding transcription factor (303) ;mRNA; f:588549-589717